MENLETDFLVIGAGIVGLTIANELASRFGGARITVIDKEPSLAVHGSGRNSGVVHAGFYYTPDSLKARLTADGNRLMTSYCLENGLAIKRCGKVVVAKGPDDLPLIDELKKRGDRNGVDLKVVDEKELQCLEPNARTFRQAIFSPTTSTVDPKQVVTSIARGLSGKAEVLLGEPFIERDGERAIRTKTRRIEFRHLVNAAGLYADKVAHRFGVGLDYTLIPFKGLYMEYRGDLLKRHVYPVPDLGNPFLGVHFTLTVDGKTKIGPTAIPAFWRENYKGLANFSLREFKEVVRDESRLMLRNPFNFRRMALEEMKKYLGGNLLKEASRLVKTMDRSYAGGFLKPGIRAQLLDRRKMNLVMDFVIEHGERSTHVLNAVSPAFTCSFAFAKFAVDGIFKKCKMV